jgi:large repetitive protein
VLSITLTGNLSYTLQLFNSDNNRVENNTISGLTTNPLVNSEGGILLNESGGNVLINNTVTDTSVAGILLQVGSNTNRVEGNSLTRSGNAGVLVQDSNNNELFGNIVRAANDSGIRLNNAHTNIVFSNDVRLNPSGIKLQGATGNRLEANNASDTTGSGITLELASLDNDIVLNTASNNTTHGIYVAGVANPILGNLIEGNTTHNNGGNGVHVAAAGHTVGSNSANNNLGWGIFAAPANTDSGGNTAVGNGQVGQCQGVICNAGAGTTIDTTITISPALTTSAMTATFAFTATEPVTQFECALDSSAFAVCTSPHTVSGLSVGAHLFRVRAVDLASVPDPTPAFHTWTVLDATSPETTLVATPPTTTVSSAASFSFVANESGSTFACSVDGGSFTVCTSPVVLTGLTIDVHNFAVQATDATGNIDPSPAAYTWTVVADTTAPDTIITAGPSGLNANTNVVFEFTGSDNGTPAAELQFECSLDGSPFGGCTSPHEFPVETLGVHTFEVRAIDLALNVDATPISRTWTLVDLTAPDTTIDTGPVAVSESADVTFTFSSNEPTATFECALDSAAYAVCTSPLSISVATSISRPPAIRGVSSPRQYRTRRSRRGRPRCPPVPRRSSPSPRISPT